jgi:hypothetical protein
VFSQRKSNHQRRNGVEPINFKGRITMSFYEKWTVITELSLVMKMLLAYTAELWSSSLPRHCDSHEQIAMNSDLRD